MNSRLSAEERATFERRLQDRAAALRREIHEARARRGDEEFDRLAGEAPDTEDAALADFVRDMSSAEMGRDVDELHEIDEALKRLAAGSFGLCQRCGEPIERERLDAHPAARRHVSCQRIEDQERARLEARESE